VNDNDNKELGVALSKQGLTRSTPREEELLGESERGSGRRKALILAFFASVAFLLDLVLCHQAYAWGPGVHTVIALQSLDVAAGLVSSVGQLILSSPLEYLYGSLAADFFLMKAHMKTTRHAHHWKGGFALLAEAKTDKEKAYAYGFLAHLAADVIAHNIFIPNLLNIFPSKRGRSHIYWEVRADYVVGPVYTRIARQVLSTEQDGCDAILRSVINGRKKGLRTRKKIYTQSVKISDYLYDTIPNLFDRQTLRWEGFREYSIRMVMVSSLFVTEFLNDPYHSVCLGHDPNGKARLRRLRRKGLLSRFLRPKRPYLPAPKGSEIFHI